MCLPSEGSRAGSGRVAGSAPAGDAAIDPPAEAEPTVEDEMVAADAASAEETEVEAAEAERRRREGMFRQILEIDPDDALAHFGMGELALETGLLEPLVRFLIEFIRGDTRMAMLGLTVAQVVSLVMLAAGVLLWVVLPAVRSTPAGDHGPGGA